MNCLHFLSINDIVGIPSSYVNDLNEVNLCLVSYNRVDCFCQQINHKLLGSYLIDLKSQFKMDRPWANTTTKGFQTYIVNQTGTYNNSILSDLWFGFASLSHSSLSPSEDLVKAVGYLEQPVTIIWNKLVWNHDSTSCKAIISA